MYSILFKKLWANVYVNICKFLLCQVFWRLLPFDCYLLMYVCMCVHQDVLALVLLGKSGDSQELAFPFCEFRWLSLVTKLSWQVLLSPPAILLVPGSSLPLFRWVLWIQTQVFSVSLPSSTLASDQLSRPRYAFLCNTCSTWVTLKTIFRNTALDIFQHLLSVPFIIECVTRGSLVL